MVFECVNNNTLAHSPLTLSHTLTAVQPVLWACYSVVMVCSLCVLNASHTHSHSLTLAHTLTLTQTQVCSFWMFIFNSWCTHSHHHWPPFAQRVEGGVRASERESECESAF